MIELRDYFAGKVMSKFVSFRFSPVEDEGIILGIPPQKIANAAYQIADAMLAEREKAEEEFQKAREAAYLNNRSLEPKYKERFG